MVSVNVNFNIEVSTLLRKNKEPIPLIRVGILGDYND